MPATSPENEFSAERALTHVRAIAQAPHPIGANATVREYLVAQLSGMGMNPQVTTAIGIYNGFGALIAGRTHDVVARLFGTANTGAILLMAHYDSVPSGPGAADDAAGVAAILETVRALKTASPMKNDLIVLITDGEEAGLLGAEAFSVSNPWMQEVGLILNFEARGNRGPSLLFETSVNNATLIREVEDAAPHPIGSSLFYALYKLLPNDTDFTVFRPARIPGLNFAFGGHLEAYHSWLDTPDNLDTASLQHHGSYALSLVRRFGQMDLSQLKQQTGDDVFFDWLGSNLVSYKESWVIIGQLVVTFLLILAIVVAMRRGQVGVRRLVPSLLSALLVLVIIPLVMSAAGWLLLRFLGQRKLLGDTPPNSLLLIGLTIIGAAVGAPAVGRLSKYFNLKELSLAGLVVVCILNWLITVMLPAASYLLFWPLLLTSVGLLVLELARIGSPRGLLLGTLVGSVMTILIFAPIAYLLYIFLTLNLESIVAIGLLIGLFFIISIPLLSTAIPQRSWRVLLPLLAGAVICLCMGIVQSHPSVQHPQRDSLLYSLNADDHTAVWISLDGALDGYTSQFISGNNSKRQALPDYLAGSQRGGLFASAAAADLKPPVSEIKADEQNGDVHNIRMKVRSQRDANSMLIRFDPSVQPIAVRIAGRAMTFRPNSSGLTFLLYGMGTEGADLELTLKAEKGVSFWISDSSLGLPTTLHRPSDLIAAQGSDQTVVCRKYVLGAQAK